MLITVERQDDGTRLATRVGGIRTLRGVSLAQLGQMREARASEGLRRAIESGAPLPIAVELVAGEAQLAVPPKAPPTGGTVSNSAGVAR